MGQKTHTFTVLAHGGGDATPIIRETEAREERKKRKEKGDTGADSNALVLSRVCFLALFHPSRRDSQSLLIKAVSASTGRC